MEQLPAVTIVTVVSDTAHTAGVVPVYETARVELAVAGGLTAKVPLSTKGWLSWAGKLIVCAALLITTFCVTSAAGSYNGEPSCEASRMQMPAPTMVTVVPDTLQTGAEREA